MSPPAIVCAVVWPLPRVLELEETSVRALIIHISALLISLLILVNTFSIQPFVKRTTMVKYTVQDYTHAALMNLLHKLCEQLVAGLQIRLICHTHNILAGFLIDLAALRQTFSAILDDLSKMRIYIIVILNIIFMIGWRNKNRIQINDIHAKSLQIIKLIHNTLQITTIEAADIHIVRILKPVLDLARAFPDIAVLVVLDIIGRISIVETIHENLIEHSTSRPFRNRESRRNLEIIIWIQILLCAKLVIIADNIPGKRHIIIVYVIRYLGNGICIIIK